MRATAPSYVGRTLLGSGILGVAVLMVRWLKHRPHRYLSTACRHATEPGREHLHLDCQTSGVRWNGTPKRAAECKHCRAGCRCRCHRIAALAVDDPTPTTGGPLDYPDCGVCYYREDAEWGDVRTAPPGGCATHTPWAFPGYTIGQDLLAPPPRATS